MSWRWNSQPSSRAPGDALLGWLNTRGYREQRRYLERNHGKLVRHAHLVLLLLIEQEQYMGYAKPLLYALRPRLERSLAQRDPLSDDLWEGLLAYGKAMASVDEVRNRRLLLQDILARVGEDSHLTPDPVPAIRDGYVNEAGGWWLDLPAWLQEIESMLDALREAGPAYETASTRVTLLRTALERARQERDLTPLITAGLNAKLWDALNESVATSVDPAAAQDEAISLLETDLIVYLPDRFPQRYAATQNNLGNAYRTRIAGERRTNLERAIACFEAALAIYSAETERYPQQYAMTQNNLGNAYVERIAGERQANLERAIACFEAALVVYTIERFPQQYAMTQNNLGNAYAERTEGEWQANLERAIACFEAALVVYTIERFPGEHRRTQQNRAHVAAEAGQWILAHASWESALAAEELLLALSGDVASRDALLAGGGAATNAGYALVRLGLPTNAALAIERGRARGLAETQRLQTGDPARISDPELRTRYIVARTTLSHAQATLNSPVTVADMAAQGLDPTTIAAQDLDARQAALERAARAVELRRSDAFAQAKGGFDAVIAEVRSAGDPADFLLAPLDLAALERARARGGLDHALIYLGATQWGGMALGIFPGNPTLGTPTHVAALDLPLFTSAMVFDLIQRPLAPGDGRLIGGYASAQEGYGFSLLLCNWPGETLRERALALRTTCQAVGVSSTMEAAIWHTIAAFDALGHADLADAPLRARELDGALELDTSLSSAELALVSTTLNNRFLKLELRRCLAILVENALHPLADWLRAQGATSVTLIPCGEVAAFPLTAAEISPGVNFCERFVTSVAPSARSLLREVAARDEARQRRTGVAALGDPHPTHQKLEWGEAEALTLAKLARRLGLGAEAKVGENARRGWLLDRLTRARLVDACCHGRFDAEEPLDSSLALAGAPGALEGEQLSLRDLLIRSSEGQGILLGLRLLILSACQTGILDLRGATDEVRSLTAGVLEAGADAAMGALWSVDDKATYLLITRFAQIWLPHMETMPPAQALAAAQHWLRTVTNCELRAWRADNFPEPTVEEKREAGCAEPERDPWREEKAEAAAQPAGAARLIAMRGPGDRLADPDEDMWMAGGATRGDRGERGERQERYDPKEALYLVQTQAGRADDPDARPYAHPYYWAAFQITGW